MAYASRALTDAETRYAQIEKELLAIVFACERFDVYIYGRDVVKVESDHQPLEMIMRKPLNDAPKRLQRMLLQLQKYSLNVGYKKGKEMYLADTLSHAYLPEKTTVAEVKELEYVSHTEQLALALGDLKRLSWQHLRMRRCKSYDTPFNKVGLSIEPRCLMPHARTSIFETRRPHKTSSCLRAQW